MAALAGAAIGLSLVAIGLLVTRGPFSLGAWAAATTAAALVAVSIDPSHLLP